MVTYFNVLTLPTIVQEVINNSEQLNSDACNVDAAYLRNHEFLDGFARACIGCRTSVIFLLLAKFLHNMSHLFMFMLPTDYLTIA